MFGLMLICPLGDLAKLLQANIGSINVEHGRAHYNSKPCDMDAQFEGYTELPPSFVGQGVSRTAQKDLPESDITWTVSRARDGAEGEK